MASVFTLNISGILIAVAIGLSVYILGGPRWWFFLGVLVDFLILSALATRAGEDRKEKLRGYEQFRNWKNVVANGIVPLVLVIAFYYYSHVSQPAALIITYAFVASACAITADKFASEFGVLNGDPIMLLTLKKVRKGTSGAVTPIGTVMGVVASFLIGLTALAIGASLFVFVIIVVSGVFGNFVDSVFGYFEEQSIGNKYTSNVLCAIAGALLCIGLLSVI